MGIEGTVPLGRQHNADQQCRNVYGPVSKLCRMRMAFGIGMGVLTGWMDGGLLPSDHFAGRTTVQR